MVYRIWKNKPKTDTSISVYVLSANRKDGIFAESAICESPIKIRRFLTDLAQEIGLSDLYRNFAASFCAKYRMR